MSTNVVPAAPPAALVADDRPLRLRHVKPCEPWLSEVIRHTNGLGRWYRFSTPSGTVLTDEQGGKNGTLVGSPTLLAPGLWTPDDATNYAITFNGSSQYATLPTMSAPFFWVDLSIEAVVSLDSVSADMTILSIYGSASTDHHVHLKANVATNGSLRFGFAGASSNIDTATGLLTTGTPYHVVATFDRQSDTSRIYLNGVQVATGTVGPYLGTSTPTVNVGRDAGSSTDYWDGSIDELALYFRALTPAEVLAHAQASGIVGDPSIPRSSRTYLRKTYQAEPLPLSQTPGTPDAVTCRWTHRLDDAGEFALTFPNREASDGILWRDRFDPDGHREWIEVYRGDGYNAADLEFVGCITQVQTSRGTVEVSGVDASWLLGKAYELDREWTAAPADVIDRYRRVPVPVVADGFDSDSGQFKATNRLASVPSLVSNLTFTGSRMVNAPTSGGPFHSAHVGIAPALSDHWELTATCITGQGADLYRAINILGENETSELLNVIANLQYDGSTATLSVYDDAGTAYFTPGAAPIVGPGSRVTLQMVRHGRWLFAYVNGVQVGAGLWLSTRPAIAARLTGAGNHSWENVIVRDQLPLVGAQLDRSIPGDLPWGGLHGRYWNNQDLVSYGATEREQKTFAPTRGAYTDRLDAVISTSAGLSLPAQPGSSGDWFSARWFGAVYIPGSTGDFDFRLSTIDDSAKLWVGLTAFEDHLINQDSVGTSSLVPLDSAIFQDQDGWVPIVVEYKEYTGSATIRLQFDHAGADYTDPGGTAIVSGTQDIPSTSLSPLGCFDGRVQNQSHKAIIESAAASAGYSVWLEPRQLEDPDFPGVLRAEARIGEDTDIVLSSTLDAADPILDPQVTVDAMDQATSIRLAGGGPADGRGQAIVDVIDYDRVASCLFDLQGAGNAADAAGLDLLAARAGAELDLRATPWENITGTPRGIDRVAGLWGVAPAYALRRWLPGLGVRLDLPELSARDVTPRQVTQVVRDVVPGGQTGVSVGFRQRPRTEARSMRNALRQAVLGHRSFQGHVVTYSDYWAGAPAAGAYTGYMYTPLGGSDRVLRARALITIQAGTPILLELHINGVDRTADLGGPWGTSNVSIDITPYAVQAADAENRLYCRFRNASAGASAGMDVAIVAEVLRR